MAFEFKFPDVGEGIHEGELVSWKVKEGDIVAEDQTLGEVETDKAVVEIPSPRAGRIAKLNVEAGDIIEVGQVIVVIDEDAEAGPAGAQAAPDAAPPAEAGVAEKDSTGSKTAGAAQEGSVDVKPAAAEEDVPPAAASGQPFAGQQDKTAPGTPQEQGKGPAPEAAEEEFYTGSVVGQLPEAPDEDEEPPARPASAPITQAPPRPVPRTGGTAEAGEQPAGAKALAMPSVRALAKEMGVDLNMVRGTGQGGRVLRQDVEDYAQAAVYGRTTVEAPSVSVEEAAGAEPWMGGRIEQDDHGVVERVTFRGVRRTMARRMAEAVAKQASVTTTEEADVSVLRRIREKERNLAAERGVRLTYLAFVIKACAAALKRFPRLNAQLQPDCEEVLVKRYYNIGLAVDTKAGLMVPNIKNADKKSIFQIAEEIMDLVNRAQDRKLDLAELHGGTFTITNYGAIGGIYGTPIMNYPEVAILGMGRVRDVPVVHRGDVVVRQLLPLSLTFDHQLIDGAEAARFLNLAISYIEDPDLLLLESI